MKKKILMVCEAFGGGVFAYVAQLCNDMCTEFDVYLAYAVRPQTPTNYQEMLDNKIHLIEIKNFGNLKNLINDYKVIKELRKIEREIKPDVIHLHSSIAGGVGRIAFNGKSNTVVYTPHGYSFILMGRNTLRCKVYEWMERLLGRTNSITLTCCKSEDDVAKIFCKRTAYVETGLNLKDLSKSLNDIQPIKNMKFTVYTLGRICIQKRPELFNKIAELVPEARFIWIGSGDLSCKLTAKNIEVTGWKSRKDALAIARGSNVYVLCSLGEAIAMSLIENMFLRKLCLVSNEMGNKSVIVDGVNGYLCDKAEDYAKRIKQVMNFYPMEIVDKAYQDVLTIYNTDVMKVKYIKFYNDAIAGLYK